MSTKQRSYDARKNRTFWLNEKRRLDPPKPAVTKDKTPFTGESGYAWPV